MPYRPILQDHPYDLRVKGEREPFAGMSGASLRALLGLLTKEGELDRDYYVDQGTLSYLHDAGVDADLVARISMELGDRDGIEIEWAPRDGSPS